MNNVLVTPEVKRLRDNLGSLSPIKVANLLNQPLHKVQETIASYFEAPMIHSWHTSVWLMSRRLGKTFLATKIITTLMLTPESKIFLTSHSTSLSEETWKNVLSDLLNIPEMKDKVKAYKKEGIIEIPELNTRFICASYLNAESRFVGKQASILIFDELFLVPAQYQEEVYKLVAPTLTTYGAKDGIPYGKTIILSTPRGSATGSLAGLKYLDGERGKKGCLSFKHTIYESPFLTDEEIVGIKESTPKDAWEQEYLVEFTKTNKTVFRNFNKNKHIIHLSKQQLKDMSQHCELMVALDVGIVDGNGASFLLYNSKRDCYYIIDEHYAKDEVVGDFLKVIRNKLGKWCKDLNINFNNVIYWYDPAAKACAVEANQKYGLSMNKAKNQRSEGIDYINELLQGRGTTQEPRIYILDNCVITGEMFEYAEFKVVNGNISNLYSKDPSERQSHYELCDTVRYACYSHYKTSNNQIIVV